MHYPQIKTDVSAIKTDKNIKERHAKITNLINSESTNRIRLRFLCDIDTLNCPVKFEIKIIYTLETDMAKLFESNQQVANFGHNSLFMQYEQFRLNNNFRQYLKPSLMSKHVSKNFNRHPKDSPAKIIRVVSRHANPYS